MDEINAAGGVLTDGYMLELIKMDDAGDYMNSVAGYYKLVEEGVCAVIGTNNSKGMKELITASSSANVPVITPSITDDSLVSAANFVYQACFSDKYAMQAMAKLLSTKQNKTQGSQSVALVCPTEDERYISLYEDMAAAGRIGVPPQECIVIEDSINGIKAGHAAGMKVVHVPDTIQIDDTIRALTYCVCEHLGEVPDVIEKLNAQV